MNLFFVLPIAAIALLVWLTHKGHKRSAWALLVLLLLMFLGAFNFGLVSDAQRKEAAKQDAVTFDRHQNTPLESKAEQRPFAERMDERHQQLRNQSDELLNRYLNEDE